MSGKLRLAAAAISVAAVLCSCSGGTASSQSFVFDTYSRLTVSGKDAENTLNDLEASLEEMSGAFEACYGTDAAKLPQNGIYKDCFDKTRTLNALYGNEINVSCGALTELWGISTPNPRVPSEEEIAEALGNITCDSFGDFPDGLKLDFGAVSKGYACDRAYEMLKGTKTDHAVVSLSSAALMYGEKPRGESFRTGVIDPLTGKGYMGFVSSDAAFFSTSGGYERYFEAQGERYCHILDMNTGYPAETDLVSVTVIVPAETKDGGIMSDFLSTLIYIEGTAGLDKWLDSSDFEVIAVDSDGAVFSNCKGLELDESGGFYYG